MDLGDVVRLVNEKDGSKRVHIALYDMYLKDGADRPSYADFADKFKLQLNDRGVDSSVVDEFVTLICGEVDADGGEFEEKPEEFAKEFVKKDSWTPFIEEDGFQKNVVSNQFFLSDKTTKVFVHEGYPNQGVYYDEQQKLYRQGKPYPTFVEENGFQKELSTNQFYLSDKTTKVYLHTGYPNQGIYYDEHQQLYQRGLRYVTYVEVDGFQKDTATNQFYLPDKATKVYLHTGYPDQGIYYDEQQRLYQHGKSYEPAAAIEEPVNLATDAEIAELLDSPTNYEELQKAVAAGELVIEYEDEDLDSFSAQQFVNID